ncbi:MAG: type II toxin-antitoxin system RelE/ParE family toxin [Bacteroidales bacterium]
MLKPVIWSPLSENDFENILEYINKNWGIKVASNFIDLIENLINQITLNPKQFPICFKKKKIRKCVLTKHNTLYYRDGKINIEILRIYDTRQDPTTMIF